MKIELSDKEMLTAALALIQRKERMQKLADAHPEEVYFLYEAQETENLYNRFIGAYND